MNFYIDTIQPEYVSGWAHDQNNPDAPLTVAAISEGKLIGRAAVNQTRDDLLELGYGAVAFKMYTPAAKSLAEGKSFECQLLQDEALLMAYRINPTSAEITPVNIIGPVAERDRMLQGDASHYFNVGEEAVQLIRRLRPELPATATILDLPCGHGRVLRHLRRNFPDARLACCDIDREPVDFCSANFGATGFYSNQEWNLQFDRQFDLVWCGSLISHFSQDKTQKILGEMCKLLTPGGAVIATTHGDSVGDKIKTNKPEFTYGLNGKGRSKLMKEWQASGYGYADYPKQSGHGVSVISRAWVEKFFANHSNAELSEYIDRGWDSHQDVFAVRRHSPPPPPPPPPPEKKGNGVNKKQQITTAARQRTKKR